MADISESQHLTQVKIEPSDEQSSQHSQQVTGIEQQALIIRLLMQGKEVGSLIGKKGDNIKRFRESSGAKINVSDSSCPDRIVTLTGTMNEVYRALLMICLKSFEEQASRVTSGASPIANSGDMGDLVLTNSSSSVVDPLFGLPSTSILNNALKESSIGVKDTEMLTVNNNSTATPNNNELNSANSMTREQTITGLPSVTLRLIIPASQCGSLIGRGGAKIKDIRELTGATIQVAPDVLPNSTERVVTISGSIESLRICVYQICVIIAESPPKGYTVPYRPKTTIEFNIDCRCCLCWSGRRFQLPGQFGLSAHPDINRLFVAANPLAAAFNQSAANFGVAAATGQSAAALSSLASPSVSSTEMMIPNGLIGCVIGKGGSKINEIRQLSGATIKIANSEEGTKNRAVIISGTSEAINIAQYLITARLTCLLENLCFSKHPVNRLCAFPDNLSVAMENQTSLLDSITKPWVANKLARKFAPY